MQITVNAYAKLNITLDVVAKRPDGYHDMRMIMQRAELYDTITIKRTSGRGVEVRSNLNYLPSDSRNIVAKTAVLFFETIGEQIPGISFDILKRIPVCAGLAGGSADAAAVLHALNDMFSAGLSLKELNSIGEKIGSDVPYCLLGGTALAEGRGEILTPLPPMPDCIAVISKPDFSVSTPKLFARLDCSKIARRPDTDGAVEAIKRGDLAGVARRMYNVFEDLMPSKFKEIGAIKETLLDCGALGANMSGTGSAVFGLFDDEKKAGMAHDRLKPVYADTFVAKLIT